MIFAPESWNKIRSWWTHKIYWSHVHFPAIRITYFEPISSTCSGALANFYENVVIDMVVSLKAGVPEIYQVGGGFNPVSHGCMLFAFIPSKHGRRKDFFQGGGHLGIFPKSFQGGAKSGEIFLPLEIKKTTFFCWNFWNPDRYYWEAQW